MQRGINGRNVSTESTHAVSGTPSGHDACPTGAPTRAFSGPLPE
jgi:hypothetical protein